MSIKRFFENNQPYHVLSRGIERRTIFTDETDYCRFIFLFYACNFGSPASNLWKKDIIKAGRAILEGDLPPAKFIQNEHPQLVDISALTLIPNHYHSILEQKVEKGITLFMQKVNGAYSKYFNIKKERQGKLFQGAFKAILINSENYLLRVLRYVHLNVLDLIQQDWREGGIKDIKKSLKLLSEYPWSTNPDYFGVRNSKIITSEELYSNFFKNFDKEGIEEYKAFLLNWPNEDLTNEKSFLLD